MLETNEEYMSQEKLDSYCQKHMIISHHRKSLIQKFCMMTTMFTL